MGHYFKRSTDAGPMLGAVRALAEEGKRRKDVSFFDAILAKLETPAVKPEVETVPDAGYGECKDPACPGGKREVRRLWDVDGVHVCMGCRKRGNVKKKGMKHG